MGKSTRRLATALVTAFLVTAGPVALQAAPESMSAAAAKALHRIVEARAAIHAGKPSGAERELREALALVDHIKAVRPRTRVADHIWVAEKHLEYQEPHEVALDLIPIEISLTDLEEVVSVQRAQRHLEDTRAHLSRGDANAARQELQRLRESLAQTEVDLPLHSTEQHIRRALALLTEDKPAEADAALKEAEAGVQFVALGPSVPLAKARRALWQAMEDHAAGHHKAVEADLVRALTWLSRIEAGADEKVDGEAQRLRAEISELMEMETHKTPDAAHTLAGYWHRTVALVEREGEKLYHKWRTQQDENHLYRQLIDAKMHLYFAEHELFKSGDAEAAGGELDAAASYLHAAAQEATGPRKTRIEGLEKEIGTLARFIPNPDDEARRRFDQALADLRRMVAEI